MITSIENLFLQNYWRYSTYNLYISYLQKGFFEDILLEPYKIKTQFSEGIRKSSFSDKKKAPNRNGILHGHRKHLDFGTELNSLNSFSLLAFVVFSTKDIFKDL